MRPRELRRKNGNMSAFMLAVFLTALMAMLFFSLAYVRFVGTHHQQMTAIDAAALTAAKDLARIVVEDPNIGFVGLSDLGPIGTATKAGDNYFMPVTGINTLLAQTRLNLIIADLLHDNIMSAYALRDYDQANQARTRLVATLNSAMNGDPVFDANGNKIDLLADAIASYNSNRINMNSGDSELVPGSFKLSLGWVPELTTNEHIPNPSKYAQMSASQEDNAFYKSNINVPYKNCDFVFAALTDQTNLIDARTFRAQSDKGSLPYIVPSIIFVQADQKVTQTDQPNHYFTHVIHSTSCAEPGCFIDPNNTPGAFTLTFSNGAIPELNTFYKILTLKQVDSSPADSTQSVSGGDFPPNTLTNIALPVLNKIHPPFGQTLRVALHDWIRALGPNIDVQSLLDAMNKPLSSDASSHADVFKVSTGGIIALSEASTTNSLSLPVSDAQWTSVSGLAFGSSNGKTYDIYCKDYVYQRGRMSGGIHGGQPLGASTDPPPPDAVPDNTINENPIFVSKFPTGPGGGAVRPTYTQLGTACDIRFRKR